MGFFYPSQPQERRHGPQGYSGQEAYKPWLRDEFCFRCVYCLCRERWFPDGAGSFSIEHLRPVSTAPELWADYDNLAYACCLCNSARRAEALPLDLALEPLGSHLAVNADGMVEAKTTVGLDLIRICYLNRPPLVEYRRYMMHLLAFLRNHPTHESLALLKHYLGFPDDLPRLGKMRPPGGNSRPEGINQSWYERQRRSELPETY